MILWFLPTTIGYINYAVIVMNWRKVYFVHCCVKTKSSFFLSIHKYKSTQKEISSLLVGFMKWLAQKQIKGYFRYKNKCIPFPYPFIFWKRKPCNCQVNWICVYKLVWWNIQYFLRKKKNQTNNHNETRIFIL